jgi:hypothetical protein
LRDGINLHSRHDIGGADRNIKIILICRFPEEIDETHFLQMARSFTPMRYANYSLAFFQRNSAKKKRKKRYFPVQLF